MCCNLHCAGFREKYEPNRNRQVRGPTKQTSRQSNFQNAMHSREKMYIPQKLVKWAKELSSFRQRRKRMVLIIRRVRHIFRSPQVPSDTPVFSSFLPPSQRLRRRLNPFKSLTLRLASSSIHRHISCTASGVPLLSRDTMARRI